MIKSEGEKRNHIKSGKKEEEREKEGGWGIS